MKGGVSVRDPPEQQDQLDIDDICLIRDLLQGVGLYDCETDPQASRNAQDGQVGTLHELKPPQS